MIEDNETQPLIKRNRPLGFLILTLVIFWVVLLLWASFSHIIVNEKIFVYDWTTMLSIVITIWTVVALHKPNSIMRKRLEENNKNIALTTLAFIIVIPLFTKLTFEHGIPSFLHFLTKEPAQITVSIDKKISLKRCRNGVQLNGYEYFANGRVCGLRKDVLDILTPGDKLKLIGEKSYFGFTPTAYQYEKVNLPQSKPPRKVPQTSFPPSSEETNLMMSEQDLKTFYNYIDNQ